MLVLVLLDILILILLISLGVPILFCFGGALLFMNIFTDISMKGLIIYSIGQLKAPILLAIPLFILAGGLMSEGGIAKALLDFVERFVGRIRGGIGMVVIITSGILGAISGSGFTGIASLGPVMIPHMVKSKYPRGYATALTTCSSLLGLLIPPSTTMIVYGWVTDTSILACFLSTVGPGLLIMLLFSIVNFIMVRKIPLSSSISISPISSKENRKETLNIIWKAVPALSIPVIVLGGIYGGIFTPTEAAAVSAIISIPIGIFAYRSLNAKNIYKCVRNTATSIGTILVVLFFGLMLSQVFVMLQVSQLLIDLVMGISQNRIVILLLINLLLVVIGMLVSDDTGIILASPLLLPIVKELGITPVQFAAIICTNLTMGNITPPYANILYLGMRIGKVERLMDILKPTLILIIFAYFPVVLLTTYWPGLSLFLPRLFGLVP